MSAAARLRELHERTKEEDENAAPYDQPADCVGSVLVGALPEIAAVIEAAEQANEHDADCLTATFPDRQCDCGRSSILADSLAALAARLNGGE